MSTWLFLIFQFTPLYRRNHIISESVEKIDDIEENLWFELKTTDLNGEEEVYQIQLTLSE